MFPLSMVFSVALYLPRSRYLESFRGVKPQLYADNLKCVFSDDDDLFEAAKFTNHYIRLAGQTPAPGKCVLLSIARVVRDLMKAWVIFDAVGRWSVKLDVRDLGGHLDTTYRRPAATLVCRVLVLLSCILVVLALPLDFTGRLGVLRTKFCLVLCAVLRLLLFPLGCSRSLGLLSSRLFGIGKCLWLMLELCSLFSMGQLAVILVSILFGVGSGCFAGTLPVDNLRFLGCIASWTWSLLVVLGMRLCTFWFKVLVFLALFGILTVRVEFGLVFLS